MRAREEACPLLFLENWKYKRVVWHRVAEWAQGRNGESAKISRAYLILVRFRGWLRDGFHPAGNGEGE